MAGKILITYATAHGSTTGVARIIWDVLSNSEAIVDVIPVEQVQCIDPYDAVVIGSAIHGGRWLPAATDFISQNRERLNQIHVAFFLVCLMMNRNTDSDRKLVDEFLAKEREMINPVAEGHFLGAFQAKDHPLIEGLGFRLFLAYCGLGLRSGDFRQPDVTRTWAEGIRALL
jgi:menaquinone-dependent protoporphyrinogen oxidase